MRTYLFLGIMFMPMGKMLMPIPTPSAPLMVTHKSGGTGKVHKKDNSVTTIDEIGTITIVYDQEYCKNLPKRIEGKCVLNLKNHNLCSKWYFEKTKTMYYGECENIGACGQRSYIKNGKCVVEKQ